MAVKRGLGRGLDNLIPTDEPEVTKSTSKNKSTTTKPEVKEVIKRVEQT